MEQPGESQQEWEGVEGKEAAGRGGREAGQCAEGLESQTKLGNWGHLHDKHSLCQGINESKMWW